MPLMTETLPTIVGAGVTLKVVDTMFGERPSRKSKTKTVKGRKVHTGKRGGKYIIRKGRKVYL